MPYERPEDFYAVYATHRTYVRAEVRKKHVAEFTRNIWAPAKLSAETRVLELGCGVGLFLAYLQEMGVREFTGVEMDPNVRDYMPEQIAARVEAATIEDFISTQSGDTYDAIVMLDVFEHFSHAEGVALLERLKPLLGSAGKLILRMPNCASPWGLQYQLGDLTHKAMYSPGNIRHIALAAGLDVEGCFPYTRGSAVRRFTTQIVEGALDRLLTDPPPIWSANFITIIRP